ncbi:hypothetical protein SAMD00019534_015330 [Acytostelium subglobosum LB1]|uniref:hypothetical protein n=1 Tax=Acytostelium subglobosum LB1 TaxID=1410327 RepID=UPI000644CF0F|nr:hypothetical protein SAMD00019534_015330 [Acytostelium subglobosum LB1]GAM18358.1 hypothetical protein SAMD00019534_015330 [Acytostelium subglobosum LB1]|eukprot:XP_012757578.1 hypothetical protein SAMD00019534_015330 [Acytostelium subglobosum LB1]
MDDEDDDDDLCSSVSSSTTNHAHPDLAARSSTSSSSSSTSTSSLSIDVDPDHHHQQKPDNQQPIKIKRPDHQHQQQTIQVVDHSPIRSWPKVNNITDHLVYVNVALWAAIVSLRFEGHHDSTELPVGLSIAVTVICLIILVPHYHDFKTAFSGAYWRGLRGFIGGFRYRAMRCKPQVWWWSPLVHWIWSIPLLISVWMAYLRDGAVVPWIGFGVTLVFGHMFEPGMVNWACAVCHVKTKFNRPKIIMFPTPGDLHRKRWSEIVKLRTRRVATVFVEASALSGFCGICDADSHWTIRQGEGPIWATLEPSYGDGQQRQLLPQPVEEEGTICACQWRAISAVATEMGCRGWAPVLIPTTALESNTFRAWVNWKSSGRSTVYCILLGGRKCQQLDVSIDHESLHNHHHQSNDYMEESLDTARVWSGAQQMALFDYGSLFSGFACVWPGRSIKRHDYGDGNEDDLLQRGSVEWQWSIMGKESYGIFTSFKTKVLHKPLRVTLPRNVCPLTQGYTVWACANRAMSERLLIVQRALETIKPNSEYLCIDRSIIEESCHAAAINHDLSYLLVLPPDILPKSSTGIRPGSILYIGKGAGMSVHRSLWESQPTSQCWVGPDDHTSVVLDRRVAEPPAGSITVFTSAVPKQREEIEWYATSMCYNSYRGDALRLYLGVVSMNGYRAAISGHKMYSLQAVSIGGSNGEALNTNRYSILPYATTDIVVV